jgi:hypothetical protein
MAVSGLWTAGPLAEGVVLAALDEVVDVGLGVADKAPDPATGKVTAAGELAHHRLGHGDRVGDLLRREQRSRKGSRRGGRSRRCAHGYTAIRCSYRGAGAPVGGGGALVPVMRACSTARTAVVC